MAGRPSSHDDVAELLFRAETALRVHEQLEVGAPGIRGRRSQDSGSNLNVLLANCPHHVSGSEAMRGELVGVEPDSHTEVARAEDLNVSHSGQPAQLILYLQDGEVR